MHLYNDEIIPRFQFLPVYAYTIRGIILGRDTLKLFTYFHFSFLFSCWNDQTVNHDHQSQLFLIE